MKESLLKTFYQLIREEMKKIYLLISVLILILFLTFTFAQNDPPKREFRAAWIATVINLDWPSHNNLSTADQQQEFLDILDKLKDSGVNAVIFQVRSESDAMYDSNYDPWSYWLTGSQGTPPNPYYDPLEFAIKESHIRGIELHAWFNPYRAERAVGDYSKDTSHVVIKHPDWIMTKGGINVLDPGLPLVRDYVTNVIMDVVTRYDVDGIHFDDYFYPYPPDNMSISDQDQDTYNTYPRGINNIGDWRRDNINLLVSQIYDSIQTVKPHVIFGISPFGIWKNGIPFGIVGLDAYNVIYCDPIEWLNSEKIDYLTPQLYWPFGGGQDYGKLLPWWADQMNGRHLMPGQAMYRIPNWSSDEMPNQIQLNRQTNNVYGNIIFRAENFYENPKGIVDSLKNNYFKYRTLIPSYDWKDQIIPNEPKNVRFEPIVENGPLGLKWNTPSIASDGDSAFMYVIYRFDDSNFDDQDIQMTQNIQEITSKKYFIPTSTNGGYFAVTTLDRNKNESQISNNVTITAPAKPILAFPVDNAINQKDTLAVSWFYNDMVSSYSVQYSTDSSFINSIYSISGIEDTSVIITNLEGQKNYYWKVSATNPSGQSEYSNSYMFTTGFPVIPYLVSPAHATLNVPHDTVFIWNTSKTASEYRIQVATAQSFARSLIIKDTIVIGDTSLVINTLENFLAHWWHILAKNEFGKSDWSEVWGFKTSDITSIETPDGIPLTFYLKQNYPNPFNPTTTIEFSLKENGHTTLKIYDLTGRNVTTIIDKQMNNGIYSVTFDGANLSSGIYIYQLVSNNQRISKKLMIIK